MGEKINSCIAFGKTEREEINWRTRIVMKRECEKLDRLRELAIWGFISILFTSTSLSSCYKNSSSLKNKSGWSLGGNISTNRETMKTEKFLKPLLNISFFKDKKFIFIIRRYECTAFASHHFQICILSPKM